MAYHYTDEDRAGFTRVTAGERFRLFPKRAEIIESRSGFTRPLLLDSHGLLPPFVIAVEANDYSDIYWDIPHYLITNLATSSLIGACNNLCKKTGLAHSSV